LSKDQTDIPTPALPSWLRPKTRKRPYLEALAPRLRELGVATICESARCPNLGECFSCGEATFLILGEICTRNCRFCAVPPGKPQSPDPEEPARVARAVTALRLKHVVITSVTRDDLADGGAGHFVAVVQAIRELAPEVSVEILVPDFGGDLKAVETALSARPEVFAHNMETVPRLYPAVRAQADWRRSLQVLAYGAKTSSALIKSGLMLGLGETRREISAALQELRQAGVQALTLGQYLAPTPEHHPVVEYIKMEVYRELAAEAEALGFKTAAGPLVRSSYQAGAMLNPAGKA
jgi:lipoyl synthase